LNSKYLAIDGRQVRPAFGKPEKNADQKIEKAFGNKSAANTIMVTQKR
jgi:hypothetical protein